MSSSNTKLSARARIGGRFAAAGENIGVAGFPDGTVCFG
jgi:hypothetical protein